MTDPEAGGSVSPEETHTAANHSRSKRMGLGQSSDIREVTGMSRYIPWP